MEKGIPQKAQRNIIIGGNPSQFFRRQLYQICGMSWTHQQTVPIVASTVAAFSEIIIVSMRVFLPAGTSLLCVGPEETCGKPVTSIPVGSKKGPKPNGNVSPDKETQCVGTSAPAHHRTAESHRNMHPIGIRYRILLNFHRSCGSMQISC